MYLIAALWAMLQPAEVRLPPLEDLKRFPCQWVCAENMWLASQHIKWLDARIEVDRWQEAMTKGIPAKG